MNDGSYLIMWLPAITDKEDKRYAAVSTGRKEEPLIV